MYSSSTGITLTYGTNDEVFDASGKKYIDFTSGGIFACNIGVSNPYVQDALERCSTPGALIHCYTFGHRARQLYLEKLCDFTGYKHAYLFSSGTEATEAAWKVMARIKNRPAILGMGKGFHAFHGKTLGAQIMADRVPDYRHNQPPEKTCGIIMEPYDPLYARLHPDSAMQKVKGFIKDHDFFLCLDEIQAGFGRTGKLFGYEHYSGIKPDFVCIAKGMGNGYPLSGLLSNEDLNRPEFELSSTHGGDPLACEIGLAVIKYFQDYKVLKNVEVKAKIFQTAIKGLPIATEGVGMVAALIFDSREKARAAVMVAAKTGLLLVDTGQATVKIGPPLTITNKNLAVGLEILKQAVNEVLNAN